MNSDTLSQTTDDGNGTLAEPRVGVAPFLSSLRLNLFSAAFLEAPVELYQDVIRMWIRWALDDI